MKVLLINTPRGQYSVPLSFVAKERAQYYQDNYSDDFDAEYNWVMEDDYEGIDWLQNNMDWVDVEGVATKINDKVLVTDEDFWTDSNDIEIIEDGKPDDNN